MSKTDSVILDDKALPINWEIGSLVECKRERIGEYNYGWLYRISSNDGEHVGVHEHVGDTIHLFEIDVVGKLFNRIGL